MAFASYYLEQTDSWAGTCGVLSSSWKSPYLKGRVSELALRTVPLWNMIARSVTSFPGILAHFTVNIISQCSKSARPGGDFRMIFLVSHSFRPRRAIYMQEGPPISPDGGEVVRHEEHGSYEVWETNIV